jgi:hypothetical protein
MRIAIMQPYIFPYIGYFQLINLADKFVIYDDVSFINKGWINRNNILLDGQPHLFTIPLRSSSQNKLINQTEIGDISVWRNKFFKTIEHAYKKAPHFDEVSALLNEIFNNKFIYIHQLALVSLTRICKYLLIDTPFFKSSGILGDTELKSHDRILDICVKLHADHYINPVGGLKLYSRVQFESKGISINFLEVKPQSYSQSGNNFIPNLSIIDVLMYNSVEQVRELLNQYRLI